MKSKIKQNVIPSQASVHSVKNKITVLVILFLVLGRNPAGKLLLRKKSPKKKIPPEKVLSF